MGWSSWKAIQVGADDSGGVDRRRLGCAIHQQRVDQPDEIGGVLTWVGDIDGNCYAIELTERLGLENKGGVLRLGLAHYNTAEEVERTLRVLDEA